MPESYSSQSECVCVSVRKLKVFVWLTVAVSPLTTIAAALLREPYCYGSRVEVCHTSLQDFAGGNGKKRLRQRNKETGESELGRRRRESNEAHMSEEKKKKRKRQEGTITERERGRSAG